MKALKGAYEGRCLRPFAGLTYCSSKLAMLHDDILNEGMNLAMEFGEHWLEPIQARLCANHPELDRKQLDSYERICREALKFGHAQVVVQVAAAARDTAQAQVAFTQVMLKRYPWMRGDTLSRLFSQGCYYAWKDGAL